MADRKEYIERGTLIARLKASPLFQNFGEDGRFILAGVVELLEILPAADVVEVVRCQDCKHITPVEGGLPLCTLHNTAVVYNDYCSYGEKMDMS